MAWIKHPYNGLCLPDEWTLARYTSASPDTAYQVCPRKLRVIAPIDVIGLHVKVDGTWISNCGGSSSYAAFTGTVFIASDGSGARLDHPNCAKLSSAFVGQWSGVDVDVWQMHLDGLWTSSISFDVGYIDSVAGNFFIYAAVEGFTSGTAPTSFVCATSGTLTEQTGACGDTPTVKETVTVYDDGTVSIP
jgi:hypothetical protein